MARSWKKRKGTFSAMGTRKIILAHPFPLFNALLLDDHVLKKATYQYASFFVAIMGHLGILESRCKTNLNKSLPQRFGKEQSDLLRALNQTSEEDDHTEVYLTGGVKVLNYYHEFVKNTFCYSKDSGICEWDPFRAKCILWFFRFAYLECTERFGKPPSTSLKNLYDATEDMVEYMKSCLSHRGIPKEEFSLRLPPTLKPTFLKNDPVAHGGEHHYGIFSFELGEEKSFAVNLAFLKKYSRGFTGSSSIYFGQIRSLWMCKLRYFWLGTTDRVADNSDINHDLLHRLSNIVHLESNAINGVDLFPTTTKLYKDGPNVPLASKYFTLEDWVIDTSGSTEASFYKELLSACIPTAIQRLDKWFPGWMESMTARLEGQIGIRPEHVVSFDYLKSSIMQWHPHMAMAVYYSLKQNEDDYLWVSPIIAESVTSMVLEEKMRALKLGESCRNTFRNNRDIQRFVSSIEFRDTFLPYEIIRGIPTSSKEEVSFIENCIYTGRIIFEEGGGSQSRRMSKPTASSYLFRPSWRDRRAELDVESLLPFLSVQNPVPY